MLSPICRLSLPFAEVKIVRYRGIPSFGLRLRLHYSENRKKGRFVNETTPGVVTATAAWVLDAACSTGVELGTPGLIAGPCGSG